MTTEDKCKIAIGQGFTYNPLNGKVYGVTGKEITRKSKCGYIRLGSRSFKGTVYAHQFAWYYTHGIIANEIDHINRDRLDNRLINLRDATRTINNQNTNARGYSWHKQNKMWRSRITVNRKVIYLGCFHTEEEARNAYITAKKIYHKSCHYYTLLPNHI